jgi:protein-tyrosine phosphatase
MFSIFKRKYSSQPADFSGIVTDMHAHLLPGIDDGSPDAATSSILVKGLEDLGYRQFIATPHIMWDMYKNTPATIANALGELRQNGAYANMRTAAEYFIDDHFEQELQNDIPLLTITGKQVLVEFSFVAAPFDLKEQLFKLQIKGYEPVLAHPERYIYFAGNKSVYDDFKSMCCLLQINLLSLSGYYGRPACELAEWLIAKNYVDLVGTDLHHQRHLEVLRNGKKWMPAVYKLLDSGRLMNPSIVF